jgi:hypothetical protein
MHVGQNPATAVRLYFLMRCSSQPGFEVFDRLLSSLYLDGGDAALLVGEGVTEVMTLTPAANEKFSC